MKIRINPMSLLCGVILCIIAFPDGLAAILPMGYSLLYAGVLSMVVLAAIYIFKCEAVKISILLLVEAVFCAVLIGATVYNTGDMMRAVNICVKLISATMWADVFFQINYRKCIRILSNWTWIILSINFIVAVLYPGGIYVDDANNEYCFLGLINHMALYWVPGFAFCVTDRLLSGARPLKAICVLAVLVIVPNIIHNCQTNIALIIVLAAVCLWKFSAGRVRKAVSAGSVLVILLAGFLFVMQQSTPGSLFYPFFENFNTLLSRVDLWEKSFELIAKQPIFGYGIGETDAILYYNQWRNLSPHNMFLMITIWGGIVALVLFVAMIITAASKVKKADGRIGYVMMLCVAGYFVYFMMEVFFKMPLLMVLLTAVYHSATHCPRSGPVGNIEEKGTGK